MTQFFSYTISSDEFEKYKTLLKSINKTHNRYLSRVSSINSNNVLTLRLTKAELQLDDEYEYYLNLITETLKNLDNSNYLVSKFIVVNIITACFIGNAKSITKIIDFTKQFLGDKVILSILFSISELQPLLLEPIEYDTNLTNETIIINDNTFIKLFENILNYHLNQLHLRFCDIDTKSVDGKVSVITSSKVSNTLSNYMDQNCLSLTEFSNQTRELIDGIMSPELYTLMKMLVFMANKKQLSPYKVEYYNSLAVPSTFPIYDRKLELLESIIVVVNTLQIHFNTSTIKYHSLFNLPNFSKELYYLTFNSTPYTETDIIKLDDRVNDINVNLLITTYDSLVESDNVIDLYTTMFKSDTQYYQLVQGLKVVYDVNYPVNETVLVSFLESQSLFLDIIDNVTTDDNLIDDDIYNVLTELLSQGYDVVKSTYLMIDVYIYDALVDYLKLRPLLTFDDVTNSKYISRRILRYYLLVHSFIISVLNGYHYKLYSSIDYLTISDNINGNPTIPYLISKDIIENSKFNFGLTLTTSDKTNVNYTILNQDYKNNRRLSSLIFTQAKNKDELFNN